MLKKILILALVAGCTKAAPPNESRDRGKQGYSPEPEPPPAKTPAKVTLTSVTLADDCGGEAPLGAPPPSNKKFAQPPAAPAMQAPESQRPGVVAGRRRCVQTSMQLEIEAAAAGDVKIKSVEIYDEKGSKLGSLASSKPRMWSVAAGAYEDWNEKLAAGQSVQVSYALERPSVASNDTGRDVTYTVKVMASVGGVDQPLQTTVMVIAEPPALPT